MVDPRPRFFKNIPGNRERDCVVAQNTANITKDMCVSATVRRFQRQHRAPRRHGHPDIKHFSPVRLRRGSAGPGAAIHYHIGA